jgi:putative aldouronate transport system substrate-binding protein
MSGEGVISMPKWRKLGWLVLMLVGLAVAGRVGAMNSPPDKHVPEITVEMVHQSGDETVKFKAGDSFQNNIFTRAYREKFGIKVKYRWIAAGDDAAQKLKLMIASGDLPDIFMCNDLSQFEQLVNAGKLADLTGYYRKYASGYTQSIYRGENVRELKAATKNGKLYAIPWFNTYNAIIPMVWIRSDWLRNLNLPLPRTAAELFKTARAFTADDPDGDGKNDTYGIAMDKNGIAGSYWNIFHSYPDIWVRGRSGTLTYGMYGSPAQAAATKAGLLQLQEFYREGVLRKDFATMDNAQLNEDIIAGKCGVLFGTASRPYFAIRDNVMKDPGADWIAVPQTAFDRRKPTVSTSPLNLYGLYVVRKGFRHPEALLKMLNFFNDVYNNPQTVTQEDIDTFVVSFKASPLRLYDPNTAFADCDNINRALQRGDPGGLSLRQRNTCANIRAYLEKGDKQRGWSDAKYYYGPGSAMRIAQKYVKDKCYIYDSYAGPPGAAFVSRQPLIVKKWQQTMMEIITGAPIGKFDDFVREYQVLGGAAITQEVNKWYRRNSKR